MPRYASPADYDAYGLYGPGRGFGKGTGFQRPVYRFRGGSGSSRTSPTGTSRPAATTSAEPAEITSAEPAAAG